MDEGASGTSGHLWSSLVSRFPPRDCKHHFAAQCEDTSSLCTMVSLASRRRDVADSLRSGPTGGIRLSDFQSQLWVFGGLGEARLAPPGGGSLAGRLGGRGKH